MENSSIPPLEKEGKGGFDSSDSITSWLASIAGVWGKI